MSSSIHQLFQAHPQSVGETYYQHLACASGFAVRMIIGGFACLLHGLLPFLFVNTGSQTISELHECMISKRCKKASDRSLPTAPEY